MLRYLCDSPGYLEGTLNFGADSICRFNFNSGFNFKLLRIFLFQLQLCFRPQPADRH